MANAPVTVWFRCRQCLCPTTALVASLEVAPPLCADCRDTEVKKTRRAVEAIAEPALKDAYEEPRKVRLIRFNVSLLDDGEGMRQVYLRDNATTNPGALFPLSIEDAEALAEALVKVVQRVKEMG